jgi:hypothetical protein
MMDHFSYIFWQLPASTEAPSKRNHFMGMTPFKVHVDFNIPLLEDEISIEAWRDS